MFSLACWASKTVENRLITRARSLLAISILLDQAIFKPDDRSHQWGKISTPLFPDELLVSSIIHHLTFEIAFVDAKT
jgi:hypothetical protein